MILNYKKHLLSALMAIAALPMMAQGLNSAYYTDDYKFRHTMNPAFANEQSYVSIPVLGNVNFGFHGNFGLENVIMNNPTYATRGGDKMTTFMNPNISAADALSGFNSGKNRLQGDIRVTLLSAGFKGFGGYNTIELSSRTNIGVVLPYELFAFAKNTGNKTYDIGDIDAQAQSFVELAFGHSRKINDDLRVGAKVKALLGVGRADLKMEGVKADLAATNISGGNMWEIRGKAIANVSMKGFEYKTKTDEYKDASRGTYKYINDAKVDGAGIGGFGLAVDLGAEYKINSDWTVNAALLDLGFISWSHNARAESSGDPFVFNGFHDVSVASGEGKTQMSDIADKYADQLTDFANLQDQGTNSRTTGIGATLNMGATYNLPVYRKITFGALSTTRFNGQYSWTEGRLSANWTPTKWLDGGVSLAVNTFTTSCGWILNIHPKGYNFFIGMDHILGKQSKEGIPLTSNASVALGMNITW